MRKSKPCMDGRLSVWEVVRAPKRFHALFSASWRRYIYLFPLENGRIITNFKFVSYLSIFWFLHFGNFIAFLEDFE